MNRGVCPKGHLKQTGKIKERCQYICPYCRKLCSKKLKSWSSAYINEPCSCQMETTRYGVLHNMDESSMCRRGHKSEFKHVGDTCHHKCNRCGKSCDNIVQDSKYNVIDKPCECYNRIKEQSQSKIYKSLHDNTGNRHINNCCIMQ